MLPPARAHTDSSGLRLLVSRSLHASQRIDGRPTLARWCGWTVVSTMVEHRFAPSAAKAMMAPETAGIWRAMGAQDSSIKMSSKSGSRMSRAELGSPNWAPDASMAPSMVGGGTPRVDVPSLALSHRHVSDGSSAAERSAHTPPTNHDPLWGFAASAAAISVSHAAMWWELNPGTTRVVPHRVAASTI